VARLSHLPLPGGDRAATEPWRMALALLHQGLGADGLAEKRHPACLLTIAPEKKQLLGQMMAKGLNCPPTSSCGRLFDAVSALLGLCLVSEYEGQAAMLLEHQASLAASATNAASAASISAYPSTLRQERNLSLIDSAPLAALILSDLAASLPIPVIALRFHLWLVESLCAALEQARQQTGITTAVLAGGCMQNKLLFTTLSERLRGRQFTVHAGELVPMNDGGLALGQAYIGGFSCV
jgi:hydrogenase maturation protein HypF